MIVQNMQNVIYHHAYNVFRDKNLPPNCIDQRAIYKALEIVNEYTFRGWLTDFFTRVSRGTV